jgi:hypothetical protein
MHNEELHNLYSSPSVITMIRSRGMRWAGHVGCIGGKRNAYRILVGKPGAKGPPGRPRCKWEDNIKMDLEQDRGMRTGLTWLRIGTNGGVL